MVDTCSVPLLDDCEIGLAFLISLTGLPALLAQEIGRGGQRVGEVVEINPAIAVGIDTVAQRIARQKLCVTEFAVFRPFGLSRDRALINEL